MKKSKFMATGLTALTLLSTGAITTYVANNVVIQAEGNQNEPIKKTIWLIDNNQVHVENGDHKPEEYDLSAKNVVLKETNVQYGYKMYNFTKKTSSDNGGNTNNPTTPPTTGSAVNNAVTYTIWLLKNDKGYVDKALAEKESGDLGPKKELEARYNVEYVSSELKDGARIHYYKNKTTATSTSENPTTTTPTTANPTTTATKYVWTITGGKKYLKIDGNPVTGFRIVDGKKYFFGADGAAKVGVYPDGDKLFFFDAEGVQQKGWQKVGDKYY